MEPKKLAVFGSRWLSEIPRFSGWHFFRWSGRRLEDHPSSPPISFSQWSFLPPFGSGFITMPHKNFLDEIFDHDMCRWPPVNPWNFSSSKPLKMYPSQKERLVSSVFHLPSFFNREVLNFRGFPSWYDPPSTTFPPPTCSKSSVNCSDKFSPALPKPQGFYGGVQEAPWTRSAMDESGQNY